VVGAAVKFASEAMELPPKKTLHRNEIDGTARFLTFSCYRRHRLFDNDKIKDRFVEHLGQQIALHAIALLAWVVMPEHVHLVAVPVDQGSIPRFLLTLKRLFSKEVLERWRELNAPVLPKLRDRSGDLHFWQPGGGYDSNVLGNELWEKIDYINSNPVKRGLVNDALDWKWSSARAYAGREDVVGPKIVSQYLPPDRRPQR
jgi:putative transposase